MKKLFFLFSLLMCFSIGQVWGANYAKTDLANITSTDVVIIVGTQVVSGYEGTYALANDMGTSSAPTAVSVTVTNDVITTTATNILWNITTSNSSYTIYPNGSTTTWLYCTATNNGVRVGTNDAKAFTIDGGYLKHTGTSRFVGIYQKQDWRCYTSKNANLGNGNQTYAFYVLQEDEEEPTQVATPTFSLDEGTYEGTQSVTISCSTTGATIYYTTDGGTPSSSSTEYEGAISVSATQTIKAIAIKDGLTNSEVATATYTITEGPDETITFAGNTNWDIPSGSGNKTVTEGTYTDGTYTIKIAGSTGEGYYINGYLFLGKTGAYVELPEFSNPVEKIVVVGTSGGSTGVKFNIYDGATAVSTEVTGCKDVSQEFTITNPEANKAYKVQVTSNANLQISAIKIYFGEAPDVATPTISGDVNFVTSTEVSLSCSTNGATIYYTTNGNDPKTSGAAYSTPFTLNATATVKAAAKVGNDWSAVAEKTFTKVEALTTMDAIFAKATEVGSTATDVYITFNNWVVSGVKNSNVYVTDGTKGLIIYQSSHGFAVGNVLSGTVACKVQLYNGSSEITSLTSSTTGLTVTTGGTVTPVELDASGIEALTGVNTGSVIKISGECTTSNSKYYIAGVQLYNTLFEYTAPTAGKNYNCTGVYAQYNSTKEVLPRSAADIEEIVEEGAPEAPTFTPAAGTYTEVKSVTITCTTEGATIYYTTDGTTPTSSSTQYTAAISVGETMTIKAIAIKNSLESAVATAAYTINLPEDENTSKTWDLSVVSCDENPTDELMQWTATYVTMAIAKGTGTKVTNYYPGTSGKTYTSTRFYQNNTLTITPDGKKLTSILFQATSDSYATALINSTWTNATAALLDASTPKIVKVTPTKSGAISAVIGATCGFTQVRIEYQDVPNIPVSGISLDQTSVTLKEGKSIELTATIAPEDAGNQNVTWSSSDENIATVDGGAVTAVAIGTATITATTVDGGFTATCNVTVIDASTRVEPLVVFQKVTATGDITDGDYLIVYEEDGAYFAFDGGLETLDGAHNNIEVAIEDGYIKAPGDAIFTIDVTNGTIKSYSGAYIGVSSNSNGLKQSSSADTYTNSFSISEGNVVISAVFENSTMSLRFNYGANDRRFRYYKNAGQQPIQLYKKVEPASVRDGLSAGKWGTICPQKKVLLPSGASFYTLTYKELNEGVPYKVFFDEIGEGESLEAGKPYLFIAEGTDILGVETGATANAANNYNGFHGIVGNSAYTLTVSQAESDAYTYYIIYQNQIRRCGVGDFTMAVGRAYINMSELSGNAVAPAPGRRRVGMENPEAPQHYTGIDATMSDGKAVKMIIGEQLFILRDGKLYDTTGRFITNMQ